MSRQIKASEFLSEPKNKFKKIINNMDIGFYRGVAKGPLLMYNKAFKNIFELSSTERLLNHRASEFFSRKDEEEFYYNTLLTKGKIRNFKAHIKVFDIEKIIQINAHLTDEYKLGKPVIEGIILDITEKEQLNNKLRRSEKKFKSIFENSPIGMALFNSEGYLIDINENCMKLFGILNDDITLEKIKLLKDPNIPEFIHQKMKGREEIRVEEIIDLEKIKKETSLDISKSGKISCKVVITPLNLNGTTTKYLFQILDTTELRNTEKELRKSENKFRSIFKNISTGFAYHKIIYNKESQPIDYVFLDVNPAFEKLTGLKASEIIGKKATEILPGIKDDPSEWIKKYGNVASSKKPINFEAYSKPLGKWYQVYAYSPKKGYFATNFIDITEHRQAEKKYRTLFEKNPLMLLLIDSKGIVVDVNTEFLKNLEKSRELVIGQDLRDLNVFDPEEINTIFKNKTSTPKDIRISLPSGSQVWVRMNISEISMKQETFFQIIMEDISNKKIFEELNTELNQKFLNFTAHSQNNISLLLQSCNNLFNADLTVFLYEVQNDHNKEYYMLTNKTKNSKIIENPKNNFLIESYFQLDHNNPAYFSNLTKKYSSDKLIKNHSFKMSFGKLLFSNNEPIGVICSFFKKNFSHTSREDIILSLISGALKNEFVQWRLKRKLEEQNKRLKEINRFKNDMISRISHELKTPLISIKGFTDLFLRDYTENINEKMISIVKEIQKGADRLEHLVETLIKSSKLQDEKVTVRKRMVNLTDVIQNCVKKLDRLREQRNHEIKTDLHEEIFTYLDEDKILQAFSNLILNAIKYTPKGGLIEITSQMTDEFFIISIQDNGIGFTEQEKERVFQQFGKVERYGMGHQLDSEGAGLGLYISKKIIELHNGEISLRSDGRGKGSTFIVSLPIIKSY